MPDRSCSHCCDAEPACWKPGERPGEPNIPIHPRVLGKQYRRKPGGGKKSRYRDQLYFSAIVYVLRTGIIGNALPRLQFDNITSQAVHKNSCNSRVRDFFRNSSTQVLWNMIKWKELPGNDNPPTAGRAKPRSPWKLSAPIPRTGEKTSLSDSFLPFPFGFMATTVRLIDKLQLPPCTTS